MTKEAEEKKRGPLRNLSNLPRTEMQLRRDAELPEVGKNVKRTLQLRDAQRAVPCSHDEPLYAPETQKRRAPNPGDANPHSVGVRLLVLWAAC